MLPILIGGLASTLIYLSKIYYVYGRDQGGDKFHPVFAATSVLCGTLIGLVCQSFFG